MHALCNKFDIGLDFSDGVTRASSFWTGCHFTARLLILPHATLRSHSFLPHVCCHHVAFEHVPITVRVVRAPADVYMSVLQPVFLHFTTRYFYRPPKKKKITEDAPLLLSRSAARRNTKRSPANTSTKHRT